MTIDPELRRMTENLERQFMDKGLFIEAGWLGFKFLTVPARAGPQQVEAMRNCFFAGAQHLFGSIASGLDEGEKPTEADYLRVENIQKELDRFLTEFKLLHGLK